MDVETLKALRNKCAEAIGPDYKLGAALIEQARSTVQERPLDHEGLWISGNLFWNIGCPTASINAAVALVRCSGFDWSVQDCGKDGCDAAVWTHGYHDDTVVRGIGKTAPIAVLVALLSALIAKAEHEAKEIA